MSADDTQSKVVRSVMMFDPVPGVPFDFDILVCDPSTSTPDAWVSFPCYKVTLASTAGLEIVRDSLNVTACLSKLQVPRDSPITILHMRTLFDYVNTGTFQHNFESCIRHPQTDTLAYFTRMIQAFHCFKCQKGLRALSGVLDCLQSQEIARGDNANMMGYLFFLTHLKVRSEQDILAEVVACFCLGGAAFQLQSWREHRTELTDALAPYILSPEYNQKLLARLKRGK